MGEDSKIQWTDNTFNPWIGCSKVSQGCKYCYAETLMTRKGKWKDTWGPEGIRVRTSETYWKKPYTWNRKAKRDGVQRKVFCGSLCDVFEENHGMSSRVIEWRSDLLALIADTPNLTWLLLTKRPQHIQYMVPRSWLRKQWPSNAWIGTSVEDQKTYDKRVPHLYKIPAPVRFLSIEPLLGPTNLRTDEWRYPVMIINGDSLFDWVIVGGESGPHARPMELEWVRSIKNECDSALIPFFMKQLGGHPYKRDKMEDFPPDLQVREFPLCIKEDSIEEVLHGI